MIRFGGMPRIRERRRFEVHITSRLPSRTLAPRRIVSNLAVLVFALVFIWAGIEFTRFGWNRISELAELPLWLIHVAWPVTGVTWLIFNGEQMWDNLRTLMWGAPLRTQEDHSTESPL